MASKRSKRIEIVVDLARRAEETAADNFTQAKSALELAEEQLRDLAQYYQGYVERMQANTRAVKPSELIQTRAFLQQLSVAIRGQEHQITLLQQQLQQRQLAWHKSHLKTRSLEDLRTRYVREEHDADDRLEQKALDEWVAQKRD